MRTVRLLGTTILVLDEEEAMRHTLEHMRGCGLALAMRKMLMPFDVSRDQSQLFITDHEVLWCQLLKEEQMELKGPKGYVEVEVVDPRGNRHEMKFSYWPSRDELVLNSGWNKLVSNNNLEAGVDCMLWSFRMGSKLCFALGVERQNNP